MPQTPPGWILLAADLLAGTGCGYAVARLVTTARDGQAIQRRDVGMAGVFGALLIASAILLVWVEGR